MLSKNLAEINQKICVACGACTKVCPRDAISIWKGCYALIKNDLCVGCGKCSRTCPVGCITTKEREER